MITIFIFGIPLLVASVDKTGIPGYGVNPQNQYHTLTVFAYKQANLSTTYLNFCYQIVIFAFGSQISDIGSQKLPVCSQNLDASHWFRLQVAQRLAANRRKPAGRQALASH